MSYAGFSQGKVTSKRKKQLSRMGRETAKQLLKWLLDADRLKGTHSKDGLDRLLLENFVAFGKGSCSEQHRLTYQQCRLERQKDRACRGLSGHGRRFSIAGLHSFARAFGQGHESRLQIEFFF